MAEGAEDVPVIYLHEIKRQYRQGEATLTILNGAKLALWAGQSVALVAPSGSGKSTLLHIAGLLETPDDGEVYVAGAPTSQLADIDRTQIRRTDIGFVYQSHRLLPEFTALENVMLPQMIAGRARRAAEARAAGLLSAFGLADRASYLQGLLTNDVVALKSGQGCYAAYLTAQGRMTSDRPRPRFSARFEDEPKASPAFNHTLTHNALRTVCEEESFARVNRMRFHIDAGRVMICKWLFVGVQN